MPSTYNLAIFVHYSQRGKKLKETGKKIKINREKKKSVLVQCVTVHLSLLRFYI